MAIEMVDIQIKYSPSLKGSYYQLRRALLQVGGY